MSKAGWMGDVGGTPYGPADSDYEDEPSCPQCGYQMDWAVCYMIDCEDGEYDAYEEDPINFDPGTYLKCTTCNGKGGWWYCPNKDCPPESENAL